MGIEVRESSIYLVNAGVNEKNIRNRKISVQMQFKPEIVKQALKESEDNDSDIVYIPLPEQQFGSGAINIGFKKSAVVYAYTVATQRVWEFVNLWFEPPPYVEETTRTV